MARAIKIILSWFLVLAVPVVSLGLACNALVRMPDIYQYKLNEAKILLSYSAGGQEENVSKSIAAYMQHRSPELQYQYDEEDEMSLLFSRDEQNTMQKLRKDADIFAGLIALCIVLGTTGVIVLLVGEHQELVRSRLKMSWLIYAVMAIVQWVACHNSNLWNKAMGKTLMMLSEGQVLFDVYANGFWHMYCTWTLILGTVILVIISYIMWKNSKPKSIFW